MAEKQNEHEIKRVWIKAFFGFGPEEWGVLGFTKPGDRESFLQEFRKGDLVLIYGSSSKETTKRERKLALGFIEIDPVRINDSEKMSAEARQNKIAKGWGNRWTYGVPIRRAWRITRQIEIKHIAKLTYTRNKARRIASRGEVLTPEEMEFALKLPVVPCNVFGEKPVTKGGAQQLEMEAAFKPSRGVTPAFGERTSTYVDGETFLYMMAAQGDVPAFLKRSREKVDGKSLVKIGITNNLAERCKQLNSGFPPASEFKWVLRLTSQKPFKSAKDAKTAEDHLKKVLEKDFESMGGEFFLGETAGLERAFFNVPGVGLKIKGAYQGRGKV